MKLMADFRSFANAPKNEGVQKQFPGGSSPERTQFSS
jgi:hypothetical protein